MIGRVAIAGLAGAVILFAWGYISWTLLPWHKPQSLPAEQRILDTLVAEGTATGVYWFPGMEHDPNLTEEQETASNDAWMERHRQGPIGLMVVDSDGADPEAMLPYAVGFILYFAQAMVAAWLLALAAPRLKGYFGRVLFVLLLGVFVTLGSELINWNWMNYPLEFTLEMVADRLAGTLLMGLVLAAVVQSRAGA